MFSGFLRRDAVELVPCETVDLEVPANAEIVLKAMWISPRCVPRVRSAIIRVSIPSRANTLCFM